MERIIGTQNECMVRPAFGKFGIFEITGENRAECIVDGLTEKEASQMLGEAVRLKAEMKDMAVTRLRSLKVLPEVVDEFMKGNVLVSERVNAQFRAVLYKAENYDGLPQKIQDFQKEYGTLVYHVVLTHTEFGDMYTMLYVSSNKEEWDTDMEWEGNCVYTYANVWNGDIEEIGPIGIRPSMGGVERTA